MLYRIYELQYEEALSASFGDWKQILTIELQCAMLADAREVWDEKRNRGYPKECVFFFRANWSRGVPRFDAQSQAFILLNIGEFTSE